MSDENSKRHAWNDVIGWIDFGHDTVNSPGVSAVNVTSTKLEGYANASAIGQIGLDCATFPGPTTPTCTGSAENWFVSNDGSGNLAGWAWSDVIGWISFCGTTGAGASNSSYSNSTWQCPWSETQPVNSYRVWIDSSGYFHGWAWNDIAGWISFNSENPDAGGSVSYKVKTSWPSGPGPATGTLISSVFDTCPDPPADYCVNGAALNSIMWQGSENGGTVQFQVASSNCANGKTNPPACNTGDGWDMDGICSTTGTETCFLGADGSVNDSFSGIPDVPVPPDPGGFSAFVNKRYFRYKVTIFGNAVVNDVIMNWSN